MGVALFYGEKDTRPVEFSKFDFSKWLALKKPKMKQRTIANTDPTFGI
jgi:hypothetical protein